MIIKIRVDDSFLDVIVLHFEVFAQASNEELWKQVRRKQYQILEQTQSPSGAFADFVIQKDGQWQAAPPHYLEGPHDGHYYYNACRVPWRLATAAIRNQHPEALELLHCFSQGIGNCDNAHFRAGYQLDGKALNQWTDGAFTAPHLCSMLFIPGSVEEVEEAVKAQLTKKEGYYQDSIRLLCLLLCLEKISPSEP